MKKDDIFKYIAYVIGLYILYLFAINITTKSQYVKCEGKLYNTFYLNETGIQEGGRDEALNREMPYSKSFEVKEKFFGRSYDLDIHVGCKKVGNSNVIECGNVDCFMADGYPKEERALKCKTDNWFYGQFNLNDGHYGNFWRRYVDEKKYSVRQETLDCRKAEKILED